MTPLTQAVEDYLALRRSLGFKLREYGVCLHELVSFLAKRGAAHITSSLAVEYASSRAYEKPVSWARRLTIIRGFAEYRSAADPATQVPHLRLLPFRSKRARPYLYSEDEIDRLLSAAQTMVSPHPLRQRTYYCLFGLLAVTGMRSGEVLRLNRSDVDLTTRTLMIVATKGGKSRELVIHESTAGALAAYAKVRDQTLTAASPSFFVSTTGHRLSESTLHATFRHLVQAAGLEPLPGSRTRRPRPHDVRHSFAVSTLVAWYRAGEDVQARLPALSAFMGHVEPKDTYWYLSAVPELLSLASDRAEVRRGHRP